MSVKIREAVFNFCLSLDAIMLMGYVYLIKEKIDLIPSWIKKIIFENINNGIYKKIASNKIYMLAIVYFAVLLVFSIILFKIIRFCSTVDTINKGGIEEIEIAVDSFLPSYLGYFFVTLSIPNIEVFYILFVLIFLFGYKSRLTQFNPVLLILGYKYYYYKDRGIKTLLISKKEYRNPKDVEITNLIRINNFTYLE